MDDATLSLLVLAGVVVLFVSNRVPAPLVSVVTMIALFALGLVDVEGAFAGFGDPVVPFLASLFVISEALDATGVTAWTSGRVLAVVGASPRRMVVATMLVAALLAALISANGAVAALLPMIVAIAVRTGRPPSTFAMPLAFAATTGSLLVLAGTPVNVLVSDAAAERAGERFGFFEFGLIGVPLLASAVLVVVLLGPKLLPARRPPDHARDLGQHARTLIEQYGLEGGLYRLRLRPRSPFVGVRRGEIDLSEHGGVSLVGVQSGKLVDPPLDHVLAAGDVLVVRGPADAISRLVLRASLSVAAVHRTGEDGDALFSRELGVVEVVIPPRSPLEGLKVLPGALTPDGLLVLAVQRQGRDRGAQATMLTVGDAVLVEGTWEALRRTSQDHEVLVVDAPDLVLRQTVPMGPGARRTIGVLLAMVLVLALDLTPAPIAGVVAACALVLLRVVRLEQAYRAVSWSAVLLVAGLIPLSAVLRDTGAADSMARVLLDAAGDLGPRATLAAVFVLVVALGQVLGAIATALITIPVALSAAQAMSVSPRPFLMAVTVACATTFLTPISSTANLMVTAPGAYRFGDFWRLGLVLTITFVVLAVLLIPVLWPF
ncbi:SLC13 family permease [Sandaracinus amylolyticus]|uniref:SLC13 family permease n=1 Tax=Sandaracinus amylolyticus TaxID=927083 RepID=UPI001F34FA7B|nr:SLC13 family permease [Sandaracinus amylolyticus]UJR85513.1 Hypothetical protein I5071_75930 [Sandaracinus amylolyticus]